MLECKQHDLVGLTSEARDIVSHEFDDFYIIYQPSSTETHVFNETTTEILNCLAHSSASSEYVMKWVSESIVSTENELDPLDIADAIQRLNELGLIDCFERENQ